MFQEDAVRTASFCLPAPSFFRRVPGWQFRTLSEIAASTEFGWPPNSLVRGEAPNTPLDSRDSSIHSLSLLNQFEIIHSHFLPNTVKFDNVTSHIAEGLGAQPSTSEFGRPNSVLAAPLHGAIKAPAGNNRKGCWSQDRFFARADKAFFDR